MFFNKFKSAATKVNSAVALGESITQDHDELRFKRSNLMDEDRLYEEAGVRPPPSPVPPVLATRHDLRRAICDSAVDESRDVHHVHTTPGSVPGTQFA